MKLVKIIVAGIVGGILIFVWAFIAHMFLPIGHWGVNSIPQSAEAPLAAVINDNIHGPGLYFFPYFDEADMKGMDQAKMAAYEEKRKANPAGIMVIAPRGEEGFSTMKLAKEFGTDVVAAILGALVIFWGVGRSGPIRTVGMAIAMGLMAWFLISTSYNIWYRFPRDYIIGEGITEVVGFALAGIGFYIVGLFFGAKKAPEVDAV